jgi:hypothetical protein
MTTEFQGYLIEIVDEPDFTLNSTDNRFVYSKIYFDEAENKPTSKHGIKVTKEGQSVASALVCETGGATGIHDSSYIIKDHCLFLCCCDTIYSFDLPGLTLNWKKQLDPATCFSIYSFKSDFIVHGEMEVKRIDQNGDVKWNFSGKDIFVTADGAPSITLNANEVKLIDWEGNHYTLDEYGVLVG